MLTRHVSTVRPARTRRQRRQRWTYERLSAQFDRIFEPLFDALDAGATLSDEVMIETNAAWLEALDQSGWTDLEFDAALHLECESEPVWSYALTDALVERFAGAA